MEKNVNAYRDATYIFGARHGAYNRLRKKNSSYEIFVMLCNEQS